MSNITSSVQTDLEKFKKEKLKAIYNATFKCVKDTELQAIGSLNDATRYYEGIGLEGTQFIKINDAKVTEENGTYKGEVGVEGNSKSKAGKLAAYIEFGTGLSARTILANYPKAVQDTAYKFFETGLGTLKGRPYLFNNFLKNFEEFKRNLIKIGLKEK